MRASLLVVEPAQAGAQLNRVDAGILGGEAGVGDVQPAHLQAPMRSCRGRRSRRTPVPDAKLMFEMPSGTSLVVKSTPPPMSTYGVTRPRVSKSHLKAKGLKPAP